MNQGTNDAPANDAVETTKSDFRTLLAKVHEEVKAQLPTSAPEKPYSWDLEPDCEPQACCESECMLKPAPEEELAYNSKSMQEPTEEHPAVLSTQIAKEADIEVAKINKEAAIETAKINSSCNCCPKQACENDRTWENRSKGSIELMDIQLKVNGIPVMISAEDIQAYSKQEHNQGFWTFSELESSSQVMSILFNKYFTPPTW